MRKISKNNSPEMRDKEYLNEIAPTVAALIRQMPANSDFFIFAHEKFDNTSEVFAVPREGLSELHAAMNVQVHKQFAKAVERIRGPASNPAARWIIIARDREKSVSACSFILTDLSRPIGST
jgi:hypothetical protein